MNTSHTGEQSSLSLFRVVLDRQSYTNILYLLISFPLGIAYFLFLLPGLVVGVGTLFPVAAFVLPLMIVAWKRIAAFERQMAIEWLHVDIAPLSNASQRQMSRWLRLQEQIKDPMTWKTLGFLLLKFPLGLISFVVTIVLIVVCVVIGVVALVLGLLAAPFLILVILLQDVSRAKERLLGYLLASLSGFGLILYTLRLLDGLAYLQGQLAKVMLGMSDAALRLEGALALAAQERARAEWAEQRRRELIVNVSHELRTPVASISGHIESLLMATKEGTTAPSPEALYDYLSIALREAERLGLLVDDLLSLARMESDELRLDMQEVNASEAVEEVYQTLMPLAFQQRQVTLVRGFAPHLPPVRADRQRLIQILLNLVRNAITSTFSGGIVSISLEQADAQHLALVVADNGAGISADELDRIFERFYRTDASRSRSTGGFGLGL
ncbi:MAG TPA: sensor domain-containing protein, partial [Ktedonobacteraceae bacterium]|nr:sensor domain-containing protein [Ktedonobacteraceae bacterium]